ncbi:response regulator [Paraburkholderia diazotrophica]|uniref:Response regulator receiver domain-containing protein n=1 Tax=Paraburkholderia diazotrophica TaxID=667676 RepID=A0A1H7EHG5_9BURK|nr:response regulator [Paraburkholderia diazotrophica]SEK13359.1 Response regulator receiver domain-containing protein [Paraburkholderia diazotrophica]
MERALLVDDEPSTLDAWANAFLQAGYEVLTAADGFEALELLHSSAVDYVIADLRMPRMSGGVLCERMRDDASIADAIFILVSGELTPPAFVRYDGYFRKPLDLAALFETMRRLRFSTERVYRGLGEARLHRNAPVERSIRKSDG